LTDTYERVTINVENGNSVPPMDNAKLPKALHGVDRN
jgi:hypothetical protein